MRLMNCFSVMVLSELKNGSAAAKLKLWQPKIMPNSSDGRVVWSVCLLSCRPGFDSESGQTNDFKIGIHSFPA